MSDAASTQQPAIHCPNCHRRLRPRPERAGKRVRCPSCNTPVAIPAEHFIQTSAALLPLEPTLPRRVEPAGEAFELEAFDMGPPPAGLGQPSAAAVDMGPSAAFEMGQSPPAAQRPTAPRLPSAWDRAVARLDEEDARRPEPPARPFSDGVFGFLWRVENIGRWLTLSVGVWLALGTMYLGKITYDSTYRGGGGNASAVAMILLMTASVMFGLWAFSYAAGCLLPIVEDTANGGDEINWPELSVLERFLPTWYVGFPLLVAITLGWALSLPFTGLTPMRALLMAAGGFFAFPVLMLSALESGSALQVVSAPVLRSLGQAGGAWLKFYVWAAGLLTLWLVLIWPLLNYVPWLGVLLGGPLTAVCVFLYSRVLGRLGWVATAAREKSRD